MVHQPPFNIILMKNIIIFITILLGLSLAANCKTANKEILTRDYMAMSDDDLLRYFYDLDDEIAKCEKRAEVLRWVLEPV